jgi:hypothetical protein
MALQILVKTLNATRQSQPAHRCTRQLQRRGMLRRIDPADELDQLRALSWPPFNSGRRRCTKPVLCQNSFMGVDLAFRARQAALRYSVIRPSRTCLRSIRAVMPAAWLGRPLRGLLLQGLVRPMAVIVLGSANAFVATGPAPCSPACHCPQRRHRMPW